MLDDRDGKSVLIEVGNDSTNLSVSKDGKRNCDLFRILIPYFSLVGGFSGGGGGGGGGESFEI
jgi:hypothetical protein